MVEVRAVPRQDHGADTEGVGGADDGAHVSRVLHALKNDGVFELPRLGAATDRHGEERAGAVLHGRGIVKKLPGGGVLRRIQGQEDLLRPVFPQNRGDTRAEGQRLPQGLHPVAEKLPPEPAVFAVRCKQPDMADKRILSRTDGFHNRFRLPIRYIQ